MQIGISSSDITWNLKNTDGRESHLTGIISTRTTRGRQLFYMCLNILLDGANRK